jgi:hypothetical protein
VRGYPGESHTGGGDDRHLHQQGPGSRLPGQQVHARLLHLVPLEARGPARHYKPLESFEIINGRIENKGSIVEKEIGEFRYASARITATIAETWELRAFPFDWHRKEVRIEDSAHPAQELRFIPDVANSALGDEIDIAGLDGLEVPDVRGGQACTTRTTATPRCPPAIAASTRAF